MTPEQAAALRAPFPPEAIGKLPKVNCGACVKANKERPGSTCEKHVKRKCDECGAWISAAHIHLDYVGHAGTTDRLLSVDPAWTWEPVAVDANGAPVIYDGGLWIRMTVCGVSRLGWGDGPDIKQMISDAIRNAAMRFGVALDLWSKEDLRAHDESSPSSLGESTGGGATSSSSPAPDVAPSVLAESKVRKHNLKARCVKLQADGVSVADAREALHLPLVDSCDEEQLTRFEALVTDLEAALEAPFAEAKS